MGSAYDQIGVGYAAQRRPDPRIAARIIEALGDAYTVLNVGAGTGNYEPRDRLVVAVDPSALMLSGHTGRRRVRAVAEALPFADRTFDAALAVMTVHHWSDPLAGLAELRRVASRQVVFAFDARTLPSFWLTTEYFPDVFRDDGRRGISIEATAVALAAHTVETVPVAHDCSDGFLMAHWRRPERYLDPAVRDGISSFAQGPPERFAAGLARLEADLSSGRWHERHGHLLDREEFDAGCRLIVAG